LLVQLTIYTHNNKYKMSLKIGGKSEAEVMVNPKKECHVFWNYENCRKPKDVSFEESYKALRDTLGGINMTMRQLNLYCDETLLEAGGRQTLNDLGCSVINPSKVDPMNNKKKETSDLRMAVDISMYAFDQSASPESCAIVLISSDSDFGHLLAQLRSRSYEIVLICNKNAPARLTAHANRFIRVYDLFVQTEKAVQEPAVPTKLPSPTAAMKPKEPAPSQESDKPNTMAFSLSTAAPTKTSPSRRISPTMRPLSPGQASTWATRASSMQPLCLPRPVKAPPSFNFFSILDDDDDSTIVSQQQEQTDLRVNDLVALVADLMKKSGGQPVYDADVGNAFKKMYPALAAKALYKPTKFAALQSGKLALRKENLVYGAPPSHLLSLP